MRYLLLHLLLVQASSILLLTIVVVLVSPYLNRSHEQVMKRILERRQGTVTRPLRLQDSSCLQYEHENLGVFSHCAALFLEYVRTYTPAEDL